MRLSATTPLICYGRSDFLLKRGPRNTHTFSIHFLFYETVSTLTPPGRGRLSIGQAGLVWVAGGLGWYIFHPTRAPHSQLRVAQAEKGRKKKRGLYVLLGPLFFFQAKKIARWYADKSLGQRKAVIDKDQTGSQSRGSRPDNTEIVLALS